MTNQQIFWVNIGVQSLLENRVYLSKIESDTSEPVFYKLVTPSTKVPHKWTLYQERVNFWSPRIFSLEWYRPFHSGVFIEFPVIGKKGKNSNTKRCYRLSLKQISKTTSVPFWVSDLPTWNMLTSNSLILTISPFSLDYKFEWSILTPCPSPYRVSSSFFVSTRSNSVLVDAGEALRTNMGRCCLSNYQFWCSEILLKLFFLV